MASMRARTTSARPRAARRETGAASRVGLIGHGYWGRNLTRVFAQLGSLGAVCDSDPDHLREVERGWPGIPTTSSTKALIARDDLQAVIIAAPAAQHFALAREALQAGKDVFVEKPLALTVREGRALIDLAKAGRRILMVGHILQYHPAVLRLKALIDQGVLGKLQYLYSNRLNLGKIRREENILWSFAPHDISVMLFLLNEHPAQVDCHGASYLHPGVADVTTTALSFPSGVAGHIFVSWLHPFKEQKLVIVGDRAMAVFDDTVPRERKLVVYHHRITWKDRAPVVRKEAGEAVAIPDTEPLVEECRHFLECVTTRRQPRTDGEAGLAVLEILERCQESLQSWDRYRPQATGAGDGAATIHPTATVDAPSAIGAGTQVWHYSHVMAHATIGVKCRIGQNVMIGRGVTVGDRVKIQNNVSVYEGVTLEDDVFCGPSMVFTNVINPRSHVSRTHEFRPTLVRRGATIGANATVLCGHTIGRYAFIGAGAVTTKDVPDYALVVGNPGRVVGWMCRCGVRLPLGIGGGTEAGACPACGERYQRNAQCVTPAKDGARGKGQGARVVVPRPPPPVPGKPLW